MQEQRQPLPAAASLENDGVIWNPWFSERLDE